MLLGPLFRFELVRLARRGTHLPLRVTVVASLFLGLLSSYLKLFPRSDVAALLFGGADAADPSLLDKFGETFLIAFLVAQQAAVLLLTPVYAGGSIAEEKEKGRLDFLLTAPLGRWELVFGKLAARLVYVLMVILTGLPVLAFTLLFGGVDPGRVLAGFVVTVVSAVAVGSFAVLMSVFRPTLRDVLLWVFGGLVASGLVGLVAANTSAQLVGGVLSPVTVLIPLFRIWGQDIPPTGDPTWGLVGVYTGIFLPLSAVFVLVAVANVRAAIARPTVSPMSVPPTLEPAPSPEPPTVATEPPPPDWYQVPTREVFSPDDIPSSAEDRGFLVPMLGDTENPLDWKERHFGGRLRLLESQWFAALRGCAVAAFILVLGVILFVGVGMSLLSALGVGGVTEFIAQAVLVVAGVLVVPFVGVRIAASMAEERAKKTLESLFALPIDRSTVLWAKVRAAVYRSRGWAWGSAVAVGLAALTGGLHPICIPGLGLMFAGYGMFSVGLGAWLGVRCKTTMRAVLTHLAVTLVTFISPVVAAPLFGSPLIVFSPPVALVFGVASPTNNLSIRPSAQWPVCLSVPVGLVYGVVGWITLQVARRRFEQE